MSWTPEKDMERRGQEIAIIDKVLTSQACLTQNPDPNFNGLLFIEGNNETK